MSSVIKEDGVETSFGTPRDSARTSIPPLNIPEQIFSQVVRCATLTPEQHPKDYIGFIQQLFDELQPCGAIQRILVAQTIASYLVSMEQLAQAAREQTPEGANLRISMAAKLQKILTQQLGLLASLRGLKFQKVRIERIDISGGQSIIGSQIERG